MIMNERIQKLKAQCFYETREGRNAFESFTVTRFDTEKFVELIVRECARIADEAEPYKANDLILKHFGVE